MTDVGVDLTEATQLGILLCLIVPVFFYLVSELTIGNFLDVGFEKYKSRHMDSLNNSV